MSTITFWGSQYSNILQGINKIALLRRWDTIFNSLSVLSSFIVLYLHGGLLILVIANQLWYALVVLRNIYLCSSVENRKLKNIKISIVRDPYIINSVWPSAWRSGLGVFMSFGLIQVSGIIYAQIGDVAQIAAYLLALRIIQTLSTFSRAPFYSNLPLLAILRAQNKIVQQVSVAKFGMRLSYWVYVLGFIFIGLFLDKLLVIIHSNTHFVNSTLWFLLGCAIFIERRGYAYSALQYY